MPRRSLQHLIRPSVLTSATLLILSAGAYLSASAFFVERNDDREERVDALRVRTNGPIVLATGQSITPTAIRDSVQQPLNPGLADYPDFVAGEAVRSRLSPDGTTLAILTAGQNSLYKPDAT